MRNCFYRIFSQLGFPFPNTVRIRRNGQAMDTDRAGLLRLQGRSWQDAPETGRSGSRLPAVSTKRGLSRQRVDDPSQGSAYTDHLFICRGGRRVVSSRRRRSRAIALTKDLFDAFSYKSATRPRCDDSFYQPTNYPALITSSATTKTPTDPPAAPGAAVWSTQSHARRHNQPETESASRWPNPPATSPSISRSSKALRADR